MVNQLKTATCIDCQGEFSVAALSRRGLCTWCSKARMRESSRQIRNKEGPVYERWHRGVQLAKGAKR